MQNNSWYVLYTKTNAEERAMRGVSEVFRKRRQQQSYYFRPFCPKSEFYFRNRQAMVDGITYRTKLLLPGYVFIETNMPEKEFLDSFQKFIYDSSDIIRLLKYSEQHFALNTKERERLELLLDEEKCIRASVGKIVHGQTIVDKGPLKGHEDLITHIDRHNRVAIIAFDMFYGKVSAKVPLEITEKVV